jgi:hypothetical protein
MFPLLCGIVANIHSIVRIFLSGDAEIAHDLVRSVRMFRLLCGIVANIHSIVLIFLSYDEEVADDIWQSNW